MKAIITRQDAENFIKAAIVWVGPGFHPDAPMAEYIGEDGKRTFPRGAAQRNQAKLEECHGILGDEIYGVGLELRQALGYAPAPDGDGEKQPDWDAELDRMGTLWQQGLLYLDGILGVDPLRIGEVAENGEDGGRWGSDGGEYGEAVVYKDKDGVMCIAELYDGKLEMERPLEDMETSLLVAVCHEVQKAIAGRGAKP